MRPTACTPFNWQIQKRLKCLIPKHGKRIKDRAREIQIEVKPPVPKALKATLRPYQVEGFHFLAYLATNNFGGLLADDMGLGKTIQSITYLLWLREEEAKIKGWHGQSGSVPCGMS